MSNALNAPPPPIATATAAIAAVFWILDQTSPSLGGAAELREIEWHRCFPLMHRPIRTGISITSSYPVHITPVMTSGALCDAKLMQHASPCRTLVG